jgi:hypothetical protein
MEQCDEPLDVSDHIRGLLCQLAYGWSPSPIEFGPISDARYEGVDLSQIAIDVALVDNRLKVAFRAPPKEKGVSEWDGIIEGTLIVGHRFRGDTVLRVSQSGELSRDEGLRQSVEMTFARWTLIDGKEPSIWVGRLEGMADLVFGGNLLIERARRNEPPQGRCLHLCLRGAYTYYLVQHGRRGSVVWHMVTDTGTGVPALEVLERDFLTLQFVLGRQMRMPVLWGLTDDGRTVGATLGCAMRSCLEVESFPPVPINLNNEAWIREAWVPTFFERISDSWRARPPEDSSFWLAFDMYLDAMTLDLDRDYLRLQIALECFAYWLLCNHGEPLDVKDEEAWKAWVRDNKQAIRAHAVDGREDALVQRVRDTYRLASGRVVPNAFDLHSLELTKAMQNELRGRDTAVHQGMMSPRGHGCGHDGERVALVRAMLVALIAKSVGYDGAINGWEVGPMGYPMEPQDWWCVSEISRRAAARTFRAVEILPG